MSFTVCGCRVSVPFLLLAALTAGLFYDRSGLFASALASAALHEGAHLLAMRALNSCPEQIRLTPFGADIVKNGSAFRSYRRDALISLAGPAANLAQTVLLGFFFPGRFRNLYLAGFALFLFNLLPVGPLDGGQALYALLCSFQGPEKAEKLVGALSFLVLAPLAALGFFVLFRSRWNFSLLLVCVYLMALLVMKREF